MNDNMAPPSFSAKLPYVLNLSNGIIGVSILAMPFCMKQCGLFFGSVVLIGTSILTRLSCNLLMKGAHISRQHSYESFALHVYGPVGKMAVEVFMILYTKGTLIAFFVIIGDLGPLILTDFVGNITGGGGKETIRILFMAIVALCIILPLSLLRSLGSLSQISSLAIIFYGFLVLRIFVQSLPSLLSTKWWGEVNWWQPSGFVQTLPIFALSLSCQTQLFVMATEMPEWNPVKMDSIVHSALKLCSGIYLLVGVFGYIAFYKQQFGGDVLVLLDNNGLTKVIKAGFLLSLAVSYPIMIFPCRSAIYSMIFRRNGLSVSGEFISDAYIPPLALRMITVYLIAFNLLIAIWIPDVELILALCGSLVGSLICFVMPGLLFYHVCPKKDSYTRSLAQVCVAIGLFTLVFSTYVSLRDVKETEGHSNEAALSDLAKPGLEQQPLYPELPPLPEEQIAIKRSINTSESFEANQRQYADAKVEDIVIKDLRKQQDEKMKKIEEQQQIIDELKNERSRQPAELHTNQKFRDIPSGKQPLVKLNAPSTSNLLVPANSSKSALGKEV